MCVRVHVRVCVCVDGCLRFLLLLAVWVHDQRRNRCTYSTCVSKQRDDNISVSFIANYSHVNSLMLQIPWLWAEWTDEDLGYEQNCVNHIRTSAIGMQ